MDTLQDWLKKNERIIEEEKQEMLSAIENKLRKQIEPKIRKEIEKQFKHRLSYRFLLGMLIVVTVDVLFFVVGKLLHIF